MRPAVCKAAAGDAASVPSPTPEAATAGGAAVASGDTMGTIIVPSAANMTPVRILVVAAAIAASAYGGGALPLNAAVALHVACTGIWLGVNVWTTFFAGLVRSPLPRPLTDAKWPAGA